MYDVIKVRAFRNSAMLKLFYRLALRDKAIDKINNQSLNTIYWQFGDRVFFRKFESLFQILSKVSLFITLYWIKFPIILGTKQWLTGGIKVTFQKMFSIFS